MKKSTLIGLVLLAFSSVLSAQMVEPKSKFILNLDYSRFRYDEKSAYLEIYYGFHPRHLTFEYADGKYSGGVKLITTVKDKMTNEVVVNQKRSLSLAEEDTSGIWYRFPFLSQSSHKISSGEYDLEVFASDSLNPTRIDSIKLDLSIKPFGTEISLSDVELCKNISNSKDQSNLFYKNTLEVVPYPLLIFGATTVPVMFHYIEVYNADPGNVYTVKTEIVDSKGETVREKMRERIFKNKYSIEVGTTPMAAQVSGKYNLRLSLFDENNNEVITRDKYFFVYNPHLHVATDLSTPDKTEFDALSEKELDQEFETTRYFATELETELYGQLESPQAKRDFLFEMWTRASVGRNDLPPIRRVEYLARMKIADERYRNFFKKGWKTDRGRIFMIYSQPDEVERVPSEGGGKPYEIWRYYKIENGVIFVFVDRGFGGLELVHSTKRGEFSDEGWQRYLQ